MGAGFCAHKRPVFKVFRRFGASPKKVQNEVRRNHSFMSSTSAAPTLVLCGRTEMLIKPLEK